MPENSDPQPEKPNPKRADMEPASHDESFWEFAEPDEAFAQPSGADASAGEDKESGKEGVKEVESPTAEQILEYGSGERSKNVKRSEATGEADGGGSKSKLIEVVSLVGVLVVLIGVGGWWVISLFSGVATTRLGDSDPKFPIEGEYVTVGSAASGWREPVRDGVDADVVRPEIAFIPVVEVELESGDQGILRVIFRNDLGEIAGDSVDYAFRGGKFVSSGSPMVEFAATSGFQDEAELSGYRFMESRWMVEVYEGPSANASSSELNLLFTLPIYPVRR